MAKRFHIAFTTLRGEPWAVEIHDTDFVGTSTEVEGRRAGFYLDYEAGQAQGIADMFAPIMGSSVRFDMLVEDASMEGLLTDLATAREKRFYLVLYRNSALYWVGYIIADEVRVSDRYYPYNLSIFAIDGISRLKEIEYRQGNGARFFGRDTALGHFYNLIGRIGIADAVPLNLKYFQTNFNWYASGMATGSGNCPLTQFDIDHIVFYDIDNEGNETIWNCYEALTAICRALGGRFFFAGGGYWFMQPGQYKNATQAVWGFDSSGAQVSYIAAMDFDEQIDYSSSAGRKLTGGSWTFLRSVKKVVVDYRHKSGNNRALGVTFSHLLLSNPSVTLPGTVTVDNLDESRIKILSKFRVRTNSLDISQLPAWDVYPQHRYLFLITLKVGAYYLKSSVSGGIYGLTEAEVEWTTSAATVQVFSPVITEVKDNKDVEFELAVTTDSLLPVMSGSDIEIHIELDKVVDYAFNEVTTDSALQAAWFHWHNYFNSVVVEDEGVGNAPSVDIKRHEAEDSADGNTGIYGIKTYFGDGPFPFSLSRLTDSGTATGNWGVGTSGTDSISMLLAKEVLSVRQTAAKVYQGAYLISGMHVYSRVTDLGEAYIPIRLSYSAFDDRWGGDFVKVAAGTFTITVNGPFTPGWQNTPSPGKGQVTVEGPPVGVPTGGIVYDPNNSIINTTNNAVSPTATAGSIVNAAVDPVVNINAVPYSFVKKGDTVTLFDPGTGNTQQFTVAATPSPNATGVALTGTASYSFPPGTYVQVEPAAILDRGFSYFDNNFTGTLWPIPVATGILPQLADVGAEEMRRRVRVFRQGVRLFWRENTPGDHEPGMFYTTTDRIVFYEKVRGERVYLEVVP